MRFSDYKQKRELVDLCLKNNVSLDNLLEQLENCEDYNEFVTQVGQYVNQPTTVPQPGQNQPQQNQLQQGQNQPQPQQNKNQPQQMQNNQQLMQQVTQLQQMFQKMGGDNQQVSKLMNDLTKNLSQQK